MEEFIIRGGRRLSGSLRIQGSKNAVLPIMAASLLCTGTTRLVNVPRISDVCDMCDILRCLGCVCEWETEHALLINTVNACPRNIEAELSERMRSSVFLLGPLLARFGEANLFMPGGCRIGARPIDIHLAGLRSMGCVISEKDGCIAAICLQLMGCRINLRYPSVGATENILMAAVCASGYTTITNCAREPEVVELCLFLNECGARIKGIGSDTLIIQGVECKDLHATEYRVGGDRIAAATYLYAVAGCGGQIHIDGIYPAYLSAIMEHLRRMKCDLRTGKDWVELFRDKPIYGASVSTGPYPGYPTDLQSIAIAVLLSANSISHVSENVFEDRFLVINEMKKFGVRLKVCGRSAIIYGIEKLKGASVQATDLRGGAALMIAGLEADGETHITGLKHIDRGYEAPEYILKTLGADICRAAAERNENDWP